MPANVQYFDQGLASLGAAEAGTCSASANAQILTLKIVDPCIDA